VDNVTELQDLGLINEAVAEVRVHRATPLFKLYLINNEEAFFGFYPSTRTRHFPQRPTPSDLRPHG
jgi:hypothetical protein